MDQQAENRVSEPHNRATTFDRRRSSRPAGRVGRSSFGPRSYRCVAAARGTAPRAPGFGAHPPRWRYRQTHQAVSRALHESHPAVDGIAYWSRTESTERCWAVYGHIPVVVRLTDLTPEDTNHRVAVRDVAALLKV